MVTATLRMYTVGFGDCFLLTMLRSGQRPWRMLVDCGVHFRGQGEHPMDTVVADLIGACTDDGQPPRLDVVVATHRHQDHISGFADSRWAEVEVGEVWLPWCEDPADPKAQNLRLRLDAAAMTLHRHLDRLSADTEQAKAAIADGAQLALNSLSNEQAMATLASGFAGQPRRRYLHTEVPVRIDAPDLPLARVYLLGPPRTKASISAMDPPPLERWLDEGVEQPAEADRPAMPTPKSPFPPAYQIGDATAYEQQYPQLKMGDKLRRSLTAEQPDALAAAAWLDRALNNTSVVFLMQIEDVRMLFPGDAQWGAWKQILDNSDARSLLSRTTLYKVSHHGSHNGTPKTLVNDVLPAELTSIVSVRSISNWKAIPKAELVEALSGQQRTLLRADQADEMPAAVRRAEDDLWVEIDLG